MRSRSKVTFHILTLFALLASLLGSALTVTPVFAAGITVTTTADELNADGDCSLREAIQSANTDLAADMCTAGSGADTITVPAGTYTLTIAGAAEDANATGDLDITTDITINGASAGSTIIQAGTLGVGGPPNGIDRVFHVVGAGITVSISDVTIANGMCISCEGGGINNYGGTLTVTNSTFSGNSAEYSGGGIYNNGTLTVTNSTFSGNSAGTAGGGIFNDGSGTLSVTNSTFSGNSAENGGGISNFGSLHLKNTLLANSASGGDCYNVGGPTATNINNLIESNGVAGFNLCGTPALSTDPNLGALADNGGPTQTFAIPYTSSAFNAGDNATCAAADQRGVPRPQLGTCDIGAFESNAQLGPAFDLNTTEDSAYGSCDAYVAGASDCTLREAITAANTLTGADTINLPAGTYTLTMAGAGEDANATGDLDITGSVAINGAGTTVIRAGATPGFGIDRVFHVIGLVTVSISNVTIANGKCISCNGGGIYNSGTLTVTNSTFSGDSAQIGGGIINNGTLTVTNSTFSGNSAATLGGGIMNNGTLTVTNSTFSNNSANSAGSTGGGIMNNGTLTVTNSTFSGNSANTGGGISNGGTLTVTNSTFSGNTAGTAGGGIFNYGSLHLKNTILANSAIGGDCYNYGGDTIATNTNNLIETNGPSGNMCGIPAVSTDPNLGALTGSPAYFPLNIGSPAINAGNDAICAAAPVNNTSQNGVTRPYGTHCDIGSFELFVYKLFLPFIRR